MIKLDIESEMRKIPKALGKLRSDIIIKSARQSINKTVRDTASFSSKQIRIIRKIKQKDLKRFMEKTKARGNNLQALEGNIRFDGRPVGMINFITGQRKAPRPKSKGVAVSRRRLITREVKPGRKTKMKFAFIARGRGGKNQVFQRMRRGKGSGRGPIARQAIPGIARLVERAKLRTKIQQFSAKKLAKEFIRLMNRNLQRL